MMVVVVEEEEEENQLIFTLSQCLFNGAFNKLVNTHCVPTRGKYTRNDYCIKYYEIFPQSLDLSLRSFFVHMWSKFR